MPITSADDTDFKKMAAEPFYSVTFAIGTTYVNTFRDWHLVPIERHIIVPPEVDSKYIEVPGRNGSLDLTDFLTGGPVYKNRNGSMGFYILNGYSSFVTLKTTILNFLHGKKIKMVMGDDPNYYYEGRINVSFENDDSTHYSHVTMNYNLDPYKVLYYWSDSTGITPSSSTGGRSL